MAQTIRLTPGHSNHSISTANCGPSAAAGNRTRPSASSQVANSPQASRAPSSNESPTRKPMMPPKPTSNSEGSNVKVSRSRCVEGAQRGSIQTKVSISLTAADNSAAPPSTHNRRPASAPWLKICCSVASVAMPSGKRRPALTISDGRRYQATHTPRKLTENTQAISAGLPSCWPVSSVYAGIGATSPPEMIEAQDEAVVWVMLLSSSVQRGRPKVDETLCQKAKPTSSAITDILNDQPILSPE